MSGPPSASPLAAARTPSSLLDAVMRSRWRYTRERRSETVAARSEA
jgi:hypothetical protein